MQYVIRLNFPASHNVAEYEALLNGMKAAVELGVRRLEAFGDSQLVVNQVMNESTCTNPKMAAYCAEIRRLEEKFDGFQVEYVPRRDNETADSLARLGSNREVIPAGIFACDQDKPSINDPASADPTKEQAQEPAPIEANEALVIERDKNSGAPADPRDASPDSGADPGPRDDWRQPFIDYLLRQQLPSDRTEARRLARRAKTFAMVGGELYKKGRSGILQRCIPLDEGRQLLQDIHGGTCGHHAAPRSLVGNAFRHGFYWPTAVADAQRVVRTCEGCQHYARKTHLPAQALQTIPITWPFAVWGLDLVGPFKKAPGGYTHLLVAVDKFSKWIEARPIGKIDSAQAVKFFTDIVHRFGVPNAIITDNGTQFTGKKFLNFCDQYGIRVDWAAVSHPQTNGQCERANGMILQGLKPRIFNKLKKFAGRWAKELDAVLWSLRTTPSRATGYTPFFMVYGAEAVLPTDLDYGAPRVQAFDPDLNERYLEDALDQIDEAREAALLHSAKYQQALRRYHERKVKGRAFEVGDLVLRLLQGNQGRHKLTPPWEGPYTVAEVLRPGTYKLKNADGRILANAWNIDQLRRFYP